MAFTLNSHIVNKVVWAKYVPKSPMYVWKHNTLRKADNELPFKKSQRSKLEMKIVYKEIDCAQRSNTEIFFK